MAERLGGLASVRVRTTVGAVVAVAIALAVGAVVLVGLLRGSLRAGLETTAEDRAEELAGQIEAAGLPESFARADDDDQIGDVVLQVVDSSGEVVLASQPLQEPLPTADGEVDLTTHTYVVVTDPAQAPTGEEYVVSVAVSLEDVDESSDALVPLLLVGLPLVLLVVGGTTWIVVTRALAPVERIRREVDEISGDRLDRRVPLPGARDEVHRLASTMNAMLDRLQASRDRQRRFVSDASHELRSPIAGLRQTAEVAREHPGALPPGELVDAVLEESLRMQRLVEQLLVLARADEGGRVAEHREVDLDDMVLAEAARARRDGLRVDASGVQAARLRGDASALAQVVRNLVDNAVRHARSRVTLHLVESGLGVELRVDDDGAGVPDEQRERVFERFVRLDEARSRDDGGSGLGLAIVREIVTAHGGTTTLGTSDLGGASFVVRLPL